MPEKEAATRGCCRITMAQLFSAVSQRSDCMDIHGSYYADVMPSACAVDFPFARDFADLKFDDLDVLVRS